MLPTPKTGETENAFVARAHQALARKIPDTDRRNAAIFGQWRKYRATSDKLLQKAQTQFPTDRFEVLRDVPVFCEHDTENSAGEPQHYDREAIEAVCNRLNYRIEDTGSFVKLAKGHTPDPEEEAAGKPQPEVLGFQGPYRVGMIGNKNPRYAIFADEWWLKDKAHLRPQLPGRSVEIWQHPDMAERFFDPVAALGAETPRLDMPMRFSRRKLPTGEVLEVAKYQAATAVMPGAGNTYVPEPIEPKKKERYMLSPEEIDQLADAIVTRLSSAGDEPAGEPPLEEPAPYEAAEEDDDLHHPVKPKNRFDIDPAPDKLAAEEDDDLMEEKAPAAKMRKELSDLKVKVARYERDRETIAVLKGEKVAAERYAKLTELQAAGFVFRPATKQVGDKTVEIPGIDREMDRTKSMTDAQFTDHLCMITENYQRTDAPAPRLFYVPGGEPINTGGDSEEARQAASLEARTRVEKYRKEGKKGMTYNAVLAEVYAERKLKLA